MDEVIPKIRKYNVSHDELFLKGRSGLYCLLPFERLDENKSAVFKVGRTSQDLASRIENYHTYYPLGLYITFFLAYPRLKKGQDRGKLHRDMERQLMDNLKATNAKNLIYPSRLKKSEWFYTNWKDLQTAFRQVQAEYGGLLHEFHLDGINKRFENDMKKTRNLYLGEIIYNLK
jgi:T5orf172 domain